MTTYILKNTYFTKRDFEATSVVACTYDQPYKPALVDSSNWVPAGPGILKGLQQLYTQAGVTFYGYL